MDKALLRYKINQKGILIKDLLPRLGISQSAWQKKNNMVSEFTREEILKLIKILDLSNEEVMLFFLTIECLLRHKGGIKCKI